MKYFWHPPPLKEFLHWIQKYTKVSVTFRNIFGACQTVVIEIKFCEITPILLRPFIAERNTWIIELVLMYICFCMEFKWKICIVSYLYRTLKISLKLSKVWFVFCEYVRLFTLVLWGISSCFVMWFLEGIIYETQPFSQARINWISILFF